MKQLKRTLAIIGVIILVALYLCTIIFAFFDSAKSMSFFKASIAATITFPVLLYAYMLFSRMSKGKDTDSSSDTLE